jgi:hypothetical protein
MTVNFLTSSRFIDKRWGGNWMPRKIFGHRPSEAELCREHGKVAGATATLEAAILRLYQKTPIEMRCRKR